MFEERWREGNFAVKIRRFLCCSDNKTITNPLPGKTSEDRGLKNVFCKVCRSTVAVINFNSVWCV
jgi:hypothetical protein